MFTTNVAWSVADNSVNFGSADIVFHKLIYGVASSIPVRVTILSSISSWDTSFITSDASSFAFIFILISFASTPISSAIACFASSVEESISEIAFLYSSVLINSSHDFPESANKSFKAF